MRLAFPFVIAVLVPACGSKDQPVGDTEAANRFAGPMPVRFGDCAGPTVAWVSGPRPQPFTLEEAAGVWVAAAPPKPVTPPRPTTTKDDPPPPDDESGGTGTAMALDEGKMGRKDSDRAEGQYRMKKRADDDRIGTPGILGRSQLSGGGAFASLTGTGDITSGFDDANIYGGLLGDEVGEMNGGFGFGRTGFGPGGGGTGWGTIGTGRYGTIGHGSGTGSGYGTSRRGGMRGRSAAVPSVSIGQPAAQGDLDKAIIRRYVKRNIQKLQYCYEKELLNQPKLAGTSTAAFTIGVDGLVTTST
ncbi:MAG: hypothetical protein H0T79_15205, partial [Deltaproteobacteria bacterium]|nr:hypothetical protein [Deltaproteobacteria bacterium]